MPDDMVFAVYPIGSFLCVLGMSCLSLPLLSQFLPTPGRMPHQRLQNYHPPTKSVLATQPFPLVLVYSSVILLTLLKMVSGCFENITFIASTLSSLRSIDLFKLKGFESYSLS